MPRLYWLSESDFARIEPLLPHGRPGAHRVDDHRVISGIVHMLHSGGRIWLGIFEALTGTRGVISTASIDSSHVKAHRSAAGGKGGPSTKRSVAHAVVARRRSTP